MDYSQSDTDVTVKTEEYVTSDKHIVRCFFALGYNVLRTEKRAGRILFVFKRSEVEDILKCWFSNKPIPIPDIRAFIIADELWLSFIREPSYLS